MKDVERLSPKQEYPEESASNDRPLYARGVIGQSLTPILANGWREVTSRHLAKTSSSCRLLPNSLTVASGAAPSYLNRLGGGVKGNRAVANRGRFASRGVRTRGVPSILVAIGWD